MIFICSADLLKWVAWRRSSEMPEMMNVATVKAPQRALVKSWKVREPTMYSAPVGKEC